MWSGADVCQQWGSLLSSSWVLSSYVPPAWLSPSPLLFSQTKDDYGKTACTKQAGLANQQILKSAAAARLGPTGPRTLVLIPHPASSMEHHPPCLLGTVPFPVSRGMDLHSGVRLPHIGLLQHGRLLPAIMAILATPAAPHLPLLLHSLASSVDAHYVQATGGGTRTPR